MKKRGRPKGVIAEPVAIIEDTPVGKVKKPRTTRKSNTTSPIGKPEAQIVERNEPPSLPAKIIKESRSRPARSEPVEKLNSCFETAKSVTVEKKADIALKTVKASSTQPDPSIILQQASAFAEARRQEPVSQPPEQVKGDSQKPPKEFRPAGTLPNTKDLKTLSKPIPLSPALESSRPAESTFLAAFLTELPVAEQPAWSRLKKPVTVSAPASSSSSTDTAVEASASPGQPDKSSLLSASPLPTSPEISVQSEQASQVSLATSVELPEIAMSTKSPTGASIQSPTPRKTPNQAATITQPQPSPVKSTHLFSSPPKPSRLPHPPFTIPNTPRLAPRVPKPSELPLEVLKRDPKFKALSRKYTALMVSIPILIATTYTLYGRHTETVVQRRRGDEEKRMLNGGL